METDPNVVPANVPQKKRRRYWIYLLALHGIGLLIPAFPYLRVIPLLWAKPTIKVDYLAECNRLSKPEGYDPNKNAGPYYDKLFTTFQPLPEILQDKWQLWPTDLNDVEQEALQAWAPVNQEALTYLAQAARQPYWWYEMKSEDRSLSAKVVPYITERRLFTWGVLLLAKFRASQGKLDEAMRLLLDLQMIGVQSNNAATVLDQLIGLAISDLSVKATLEVLTHSSVSFDANRYVLKTLEIQLTQLQIPIFSQSEVCLMYDWTQRSFTEDGKGNGRLIPRQLYEHKKADWKQTTPFSYWDAFVVCASHPDRQRTLKTYDAYVRTAKKLVEQTPWQMHKQGTSYEESFHSAAAGNYTIEALDPWISGSILVYWKDKADMEATVAILAILVYKAKKGHLPQSLDDLVAAGYLKNVPMDPFSDGPLVYKVTGESFTLYSVGQNFQDDGGEPGKWNQDPPMGDQVFWPVQPVKDELHAEGEDEVG